MDRKKLQIILGSLVVILLLLISFSFGVSIGYNNQPAAAYIVGISNKEPEPSLLTEVDFSPFWQAWRTIDQKYVNGTTTETNPQERVWGAISGMINSLDDPYTVFLPPVEKVKFEEDISGNFGGVGMEVGIRDGQITVIAPLPNTPAKKAGIEPGDIILAIDGQLTSGLNVDEAVNKIRGKEGTKVNLLIRRGDNPGIEIDITRGIITIPTINTKITPEGVFVISLYNFSAQSPNLFRQALREFIQSGSDKLILDLRGNPGGYLEASVDIASWFLPTNKVVVREVRKDESEEKAYRSYGYDIFTDDLKMVVLIDRGSASASEILAGALSEYDKATLIGEKTFGKGSVQELVPITNDTSLKITIAKWLTPNGHSISNNGLEPDIEVILTREDVESGVDPQLNEAINYLLTK